MHDFEWFRSQSHLYAPVQRISSSVTLLRQRPSRYCRLPASHTGRQGYCGEVADASLLGGGHSSARLFNGPLRQRVSSAAAPALLCLAVLFEPLRPNLEVAHLYGFIFLLQSLSCWLWLRGRPAATGAITRTFLALKGFGVTSVGRRDYRGRKPRNWTLEPKLYCRPDRHAHLD